MMDYDNLGTINAEKICYYLHEIGIKTFSSEDINKICNKQFKKR